MKMTTSLAGINEEMYGYSVFNRLGSITNILDNGKTYSTSLQNNSAGQVTQLTYPSARVLPILHDNFGRLSSIGGTGAGGNGGGTVGYLGAINYNAAEQYKSFTLGNGVVETFGDDTNRLKLTTEQAAKGSTSLMNLTHSYSAQAGQMGTGTTAGNTGELMSISGTIN